MISRPIATSVLCDFDALACEVFDAKRDAECESARLMIVNPPVSRGIAWNCAVTADDFGEPDFALAFICAVEAGRLRLGRGPALRALAAAWRMAGWWDRTIRGPAPIGGRWSYAAISGWICALTGRAGWRATYRTDLRDWLERLRDLNRRIETAQRHADLARRALMGDTPAAADARRRRAG